MDKLVIGLEFPEKAVLFFKLTSLLKFHKCTIPSAPPHTINLEEEVLQTYVGEG